MKIEEFRQLRDGDSLLWVGTRISPQINGVIRISGGAWSIKWDDRSDLIRGY